MNRGSGALYVVGLMIILYSVLFSYLFDTKEVKSILDQFNNLPKMERQ